MPQEHSETGKRNVAFTAWTTGDIHGIGPEIILKSFPETLGTDARPVAVGSAESLRSCNARLELGVETAVFESFDELEQNPPPQGVLPVVSVAEPSGPVLPGVVSAEAGRIAMKAVETAGELCLGGRVRAMVTAPIHKEAIAMAGYRNTGHTDYLSKLCGGIEPTMFFYDTPSRLAVALATIHVPLREVPELVRSMDLRRRIERLLESLRVDFGIAEPRLAVLGLNPHASDGGVMGDEEREVIEPCIRQLPAVGAVEGPFPADGFFGAERYRDFDAVLAMYHDQGLLPFKVLAFETGVNVTLGLPIVRTSPDHGTGFDIAGRGCASHASFSQAAQLAETIADNRARASERQG